MAKGGQETWLTGTLNWVSYRYSANKPYNHAGIFLSSVFQHLYFLVGGARYDSLLVWIPCDETFGLSHESL